MKLKGISSKWQGGLCVKGSKLMQRMREICAIDIYDMMHSSDLKLNDLGQKSS